MNCVFVLCVCVDVQYTCYQWLLCIVGLCDMLVCEPFVLMVAVLLMLVLLYVCMICWCVAECMCTSDGVCVVLMMML